MGKIAGPDLWVIWLNLAGSLFACIVNAWSARHGWPDWSPLRWSVAAIACLYVMGYISLLAGWVPLDVWSRFFRGVSPVAWVVVWAGPPLHAARITRKLRQETVPDAQAKYDARVAKRESMSHG